MNKIKNLTPAKIVEAAKAKGQEISLERAEAILEAKKGQMKAEAVLQKKYGKGSGFINKQGMPAEVNIVPGSYRHGSTVTQLDDKGEKVNLDNKTVVQIECAHEGCSEKRWVATSDLQNVNRCHEHAKEWRKKSRKKAKAKSAAADLEAASLLDDLLS